MPLYEYQCVACGHRMELIQSFGDPAPEGCEKCGGGIKKLLSSPAVQFKGSGWYVSDYGRGGSSEKTSAAAKDATQKTDEPSKADDSKKTDAAVETKAKGVATESSPSVAKAE